MTDGKLVPNAVYRWTGKPIEVTFDFGAPREVGGVRIMSGRSWVNCCVRKASFYDANGCPRVRLTDDELKTLALWIDLGVPFVGGYCECNTWTDVQKRRYLWFQNKRVYFAGQELNDIRREKGLGPVPLDGYVPGIDCPDKMKNWFD